MKLSAELARRLRLTEVPGSDRYRIVIPEYANIAADTVGRFATSDAPAVIFDRPDGTVQRTSYRELDVAATRLAAGLAGMGVGRGDVVAVHTGQRPETAVTHLAVYKLGAVVATISQLYGPETLKHILADSRARVLVTQDAAWAPLRSLRPAVTHCLVVGEASASETPFEQAVATGATITPVRTRAEDPALIVYTSGSTGLPKGVLHAHRIMHAYRPTLALFYNLEIEQDGLVLWTSADWAWVGGLLDVVLAAFLYGHPVVASQQRFSAEHALDLMARHGVTHGLLTPTALKRLARVPQPRTRWPLRVRTLFTGGEALAPETLVWLERELGVVCNEGYGMSEVNHVIGNCRRLRPIKPGSMGFEFPGHVAALVDEAGRPVEEGAVGEIVTTADDPTLFLGYWGRPDLTEAMRLGAWIRTHDLAARDADGYYWYRGRNDDLIKSAGFRIGPVEIENVLLAHPAVAEAGVIGSPDAERGHVVKAYVRVANGAAASEALIAELQAHVKGRLGAYKYPRVIEFVNELPMTSTGKISRAELRRRDQWAR